MNSVGSPVVNEVNPEFFSSRNSEPMKFIDLFAGLGGFHTGFANSGYECVFACEIEPHLRTLYKENYGIEPHGDITKVNEVEIPEHDVMCAGFPCQPFSLAGKKKGAECPASGRLIDHVIRIAKHHTPKFVVLENVPNVLGTPCTQGLSEHFLLQQRLPLHDKTIR